jgi:hypothetical protein
MAARYNLLDSLERIEGWVKIFAKKHFNTLTHFTLHSVPSHTLNVQF